jgi:ankyrin repeat protein
MGQPKKAWPTRSEAHGLLALIEDKGTGGTTPLMKAVDRGDVSQVQQLLNWGVDLNVLDSAGRTVMERSEKTASPEVLKALQDAKAKRDAAARTG